MSLRSPTCARPSRRIACREAQRVGIRSRLTQPTCLPQFKDARLVAIPKAKLLPQEERPEAVAREVLAFLAA